MMTPSSLLVGLRVIDLTQGISGPYCTKLMADYGAEVIKIERPGTGDMMRSRGPFPGDRPHHERSGLFLSLNTNKKSVTLNLKSETGKSILRRLIASAAIVVEGFRPGVAERLGFGPEAVRALQPTVTMTSISNFGQHGPYRDYRATELTAYAIGASMHSTGVPELGPLKLGGTTTLFQAGNLAAAVTLAAWYGVRQGSPGQHIDYSIMEGQMASPDRNGQCLLGIAYSGDSAFRRAHSRRFTLLPFGAYPCADGYAHFTAAQPHWWARFCEIMGHPELINDPRFAGPNFYNMDMIDEFDAYFLPWILSKTKREVMETCPDVAGSPVNTMEDLFNDRHFRERSAFAAIAQPAAGRHQYPGAPFRPAKAPWRTGPAPTLGQHNEAILCEELGYARDSLVKMARAGVL
jgi:crotonobetainyl-CoA:carnitine CoA-transferase CaiB-like acyl-CoA transferase